MEKILRGALLERVSTDDQAKFGDSLEAQHDTLVAYANDNNIKIAGVYRDEGYSARKSVLKRPAMLELIEDIKMGKIDIILFTKIDRFFRNIKEYYKLQEILERHNVVWKAVLEDYNTATADGRLKVNIMLSVAENEADRTSERIKFVFQSKVMRKEAIIPDRSAPLGYKVATINGVRRIVKDEETREMMEYFFKIALSTSIRQAVLLTEQKFGIKRDYTVWNKFCKNELYKGTYRGVEDYCEPYITKSQFDSLHSTNNFRKAANNRVYIFTGLINCPYCGTRMTSRYVMGRQQGYHYYRCKNRIVRRCDIKDIPEKKVERYVLDHIKEELEKFILEVEAKQPKAPKKNDNSTKFKEQLRRINVAYQAGNLEDEEYLKLAKEIKAKIAKASDEEKEDAHVDVEALKDFLNSGFEDIYDSLTEEEKQRLWRSIIKEIKFDGEAFGGIIFRT